MKIINKKNFAKIVLDKDIETFIIYIKAPSFSSIFIKLAYKDK